MTLFAKTLLIIVAEVALNALMWIVSAIVFTRSSIDRHKILGLALVAWTTGLRHGLDADHISAIDNATRRIVSVPQVDHNGKPRIRRPVTVGLFFSLGHSTIVVVTTIVIAISAGLANSLDVYGDVGGIIGASISGSFLVLIGCINTVILYRTWSRLKAAKRKREASTAEDLSSAPAPRFDGFLTRLAMPILRTVDRPWKLYPVGLLFGLGFDTASTIALLSVAVIAQQESGGGGAGAGNGSVVLLALLFTAGMTLVDSLDSCLMIWAYAPDLARNGRRKLALWEAHTGQEKEEAEKEAGVINREATDEQQYSVEEVKAKETDRETKRADNAVPLASSEGTNEGDPPDQLLVNLDESASRLSMVLTLLSILIAFAIGIIVLLGLIGDQCIRCSQAADLQEEHGKGGLEGRWWLAWRQANDNSGYVGAAIVGLFAVSVLGYFVTRWVRAKRKSTDSIE